MKRSEMVMLMTDFYNTIPDNASTYHEMDVLLSRIQYLGMLPPHLHTAKLTGNIWELEDDEIPYSVQDTILEVVSKDFWEHMDIPYGKSIVEEVNAEIKELNRIVDILKEIE